MKNSLSSDKEDRLQGLHDVPCKAYSPLHFQMNMAAHHHIGRTETDGQ